MTEGQVRSTTEGGKKLWDFAADEARLIRELGPSSLGLPLARARAEALDRAIRSVVFAHKPSVETEVTSGWCILAVGGYGRSELSPRSDIDLLILTRHRETEIEELARSVFYSLWDAGLTASPSVRTLAEGLSLAARDLSAKTASLQARLLVGDASLYEEFQRRVLADSRREKGKPFLKALLADIRLRHAKSADATFNLQPDIKEGRGGLRDVHSLCWAGLVALGAATPRDLGRLGYFSEEEAAAVDRAVDYILRVRRQLHIASGRPNDRLFFAYQSDVALGMGYATENGITPVVALNRDLSIHAAVINWASDSFWERLESEVLESHNSRSARRTASFGARTNGKPPDLPIDLEKPFGHDEALWLFAEAARRGQKMSHTLSRIIKTRLEGQGPIEAWSGDALLSFLDILRANQVADSLLESLDDCGLLEACIPEWKAIRYLVHDDFYHQLTVDRHSAVAVELVGKLASGQGAEGPLAAAIAADLPSLSTVLLAALLHDIGKGTPGADHSVVGIDLVERIGIRMGLLPETLEDLKFLVREHLTLARIATRRDLDDESLIQSLAQRIGAPDRLRMLYLLTVADSIATGPSAWTEWKAALVRDLFFRTLRSLLGETRTGESSETLLKMRRNELGSVLRGAGPSEEVERFLQVMPATYLLSQPASAIREDFRLRASLRHGGSSVGVRHTTGASYDELTLVGPDQPGLLWRVCGVFALHSVNVLEARVYTDANGEVLDSFRLADAFESEISAEKREGIARDVERALEGRLSLSYRLGRKLRHYRSPRSEPEVKTRVAVDNNVSAEWTVVEVHARDRLGLLYAITRTLSELNVVIYLAKVATRGPEAIDVFYVQDIRRRKLTDEEHIGELERAIQFELDEFGLERKG